MEEDSDTPCQDNKFVIMVATRKFKIQFRKMHCDWLIVFFNATHRLCSSEVFKIFDNVSNIL